MKSVFGGLLILLVVGCNPVRVDRSDISDFEALGYGAYRWNHAPLDVDPADVPALAAAGPIFRDQVNRVLRDKGYVESAADAQFVVSVDFSQTYEGGDLRSNADVIDPVRILRVDRAPDQATVDNAYALAGPRKVYHIQLRFQDVEDQRPLWSAAMSRLVENVNIETAEQVDTDDLTTNASRVLRRAMRSIPVAPGR